MAEINTTLNKYKEIIDINSICQVIFKNIRDIIILDVPSFDELQNNIRIAFIHLEPGIVKTINLEDVNKYIEELNTKVRIKMLDKILQHNPDVIIGTFNFTLTDPETKYLISKKHYPQNNTSYSTINKRFDHCFIKNKQKCD